MPTLLFQGDSITDCGREQTGGAGYPAVNLGPGYAGLIASRLWCDQPARDWKILNRGISGNRVTDLYSRWKRDCLNLEPDILSILIGVNDTWHEFGNRDGVEVPRYEEFYRRILEWTRTARPGIRFVLMEPFVLPFGAVGAAWVPEIDARRAVVRKLAAEFDAVFVPLQEPLLEKAKLAPPAHWLVDGVHPTPAGHQVLADAWFTAVGKLLG